MNPGKALTGSIIIAIGLIFLGINLDWWDPTIWGDIWHYWPLILIAIGLWLILRNVVAFLLIFIGILALLAWLVNANIIDRQTPPSPFASWQLSGETATFNQQISTTATTPFLADLGGRYEITIRGTDSASVEADLTGPKEIIDDLTLEMRDNRVVLTERSEGGIRINIFRGLSKVTGTVMIPRTSPLELELSGLTNVTVENHEATLRLDNSGATHVTFADAITTDPSIDISGSGSITLDQCRGDAEISVSGSGKVAAKDCDLQQLSVRTSGSGEVDIKSGSLRDLSIRSSGSSRIRVPKPSGTTNQDTSGSSSIQYYE